MSDVQCSTSSPDADDRNADNSKTSTLNARFNGTLQMLVLIAGCLLLAQRMLVCPGILSQFTGVLFGTFIGFFAFNWMRLHSFALSRKRRAWFNEANILETYQPRARAMGQLFQPDPVEPVALPIVAISDTADVAAVHTDEEKSAFTANRNAHEVNLFDVAMQLNKELAATGDHGSAHEEVPQLVSTDKGQIDKEGDVKRETVQAARRTLCHKSRKKN